jgi:hypothetical protein
MPYPPGWRRIHGDSGTASAALLAGGGRFLGYLNLTPRQGPESLGNWLSFRPGHNREEGDREVHRLAGASNLVFANARGSCVRDSYTTETGARYIEIACLVVGQRSAVVIVGAAPPGDWAQQSGDIKRAIAGVRV